MTSDCERLKALETAAFIRGDACSFYTELRILVYCGDAASIYYPGYEILCAVRAGDEDRLPPTLKATLRAARQMVSSVYGTDEERQVQRRYSLHQTREVGESAAGDAGKDCSDQERDHADSGEPILNSEILFFPLADDPIGGNDDASQRRD